MSTTPKAFRRERGYYQWRRYQPAAPVGEFDLFSVGPADRWYCRRACSPDCPAGRTFRRMTALHSAYRRRKP